MADFRTDPGERSVAELEREVDQERSRLGDTIDALQAKASVGNVLDEVFKVVRDNGGDMSRNLGRTVRDNPLPALLAGVGLAWLMASSGRSDDRWGDREGAFDPDYRTRPLGSDPLSAPMAHRGGTGGIDPYGADPFGEDGEEGRPIRERASEAMADVGDRVSGLAHAAGERMTDAGAAMQHAGRSARHQVSRARHRAAHAGTDVRQTFDGLIEEQPLVLGALALAIGAAIGGALPGSSVEDRAFGARSDQAKDSLRDLAADEGRKLQATAKAVASEAGAIVEETSAELGAAIPDGSSLVDTTADRLKQAAGRLRDAGSDEATSGETGREDADYVKTQA